MNLFLPTLRMLFNYRATHSISQVSGSGRQNYVERCHIVISIE